MADSDPNLAGEKLPRGPAAMIICSCNVLSDHDIRGVVEASDSRLTAAQVYGCLDCVPECGRCAPAIHRIMADASDGDGAAES